MKNILVSIGCILLFGCQSVATPPDNDANPHGQQRIIFNDTELFVPAILSVRPSAEPSLRRFIDNDRNDNDLDQSDEYRIELWAKADTCSPSLTGASEMEPLNNANGKAEWGRLDWTQWRIIDKAYPDALCKVPLDKCTDVDEWSYEGCQKGQAAYALCSEKDGKTVVICISQMTDNPKQAQEIFETFRWVR